ncbi:MAG TPA: RIP metalloprotease RseP [Luteolibacter sp.]
MPDIAKILHVALLVAVVLVSFNLIIFVHELGHFLAAKWRGLKVERFQIWFGRPIWKKDIGGVQYGLGWIPAGGFVALPQMAPMEAIEGGNKTDAPLPPIKPLDKIIVAFAGPLFSLLLALLAATVVWKIGKPADIMPSQVIGSVEKDSPGEKAGLKVGDKILKVNGKDVHAFRGRLDSIYEQIILSEGNDITFTVERPGEPQPLTLTSTFEIDATKWYQRRALRRVGIGPEITGVEIATVMTGDPKKGYPPSPAEKAGLKPGDRLLRADGQAVPNSEAFLAIIKNAGTRPFEIDYEREGKPATVTLAAVVPVSPAGKGPMIGIGPVDTFYVDETMQHPGPLQQVKDSLETMWMTISKLVSPKSNIGIDHLSGPIGIGMVKYAMLEMDHPLNRLLGFFVLFNVNLAVFNMLPLPVLDGGHITLAVPESIARRPVRARALEWVQTGFALLLMTLMLYITSKDIGDRFDDRKNEPIVFPQS